MQTINPDSACACQWREEEEFWPGSEQPTKCQHPGQRDGPQVPAND